MVVVGDALLDRTWEGTADRLCPDSVGPVVDLRRESWSAGGAALTALAAAALGTEVVFVTALGDDDAGDLLRDRLGRAGVTVIDLGLHGPTPEKIRVRCEAGTVARLDRGGARVAALGDLGADAGVRRRVEAALAATDVVLLSDYGRGLVTAVVDAVRVTDRSGGRLPLTTSPHGTPRVPVVWDPHPASTRPDTALTIATPNLREAAAIGGAPPIGTGPGAEHLARCVATRWRCVVAVTCGADGAVVAVPEMPGPEMPGPEMHGPEMHGNDPSSRDVPAAGPAAPIRTHRVPAEPAAGDPCGAGDWLAAGTARALGRGASPVVAVRDGCRAAAAWVRSGPALFTAWPPPGSSSIGDASPSISGAAVSPRTTVVATSGCFDVLHVGHLAMLRHARALGDRLVVLVNSDASVRRLKGQGRPVNAEGDRVALLEGLACVDEVRIFDELTPCRALEELRPSIFVKGADYAGRHLPEEETIRAWGGRLVLVPLVSGRSTTRVLRVAGELAVRQVG